MPAICAAEHFHCVCEVSLAVHVCSVDAILGMQICAREFMCVCLIIYQFSLALCSRLAFRFHHRCVHLVCVCVCVIINKCLWKHTNNDLASTNVTLISSALRPIRFRDYWCKVRRDMTDIGTKVFSMRKNKQNTHFSHWSSSSIHHSWTKTIYSNSLYYIFCSLDNAECWGVENSCRESGPLSRR